MTKKKSSRSILDATGRGAHNGMAKVCTHLRSVSSGLQRLDEGEPRVARGDQVGPCSPPLTLFFAGRDGSGVVRKRPAAFAEEPVALTHSDQST